MDTKIKRPANAPMNIDQNFFGLATLILGVGGFIWRAFNSIDKKFEQIDKKFEHIDNKFDSLETKMNNRFDQLEVKIDVLFRVTEKHNTRISVLETKIEHLAEKRIIG